MSAANHNELAPSKCAMKLVAEARRLALGSRKGDVRGECLSACADEIERLTEIVGRLPISAFVGLTIGGKKIRSWEEARDLLRAVLDGKERGPRPSKAQPSKLT